ncbi:TonB-dependent receptor [Hyphomonas neptunium ATCC 15444]|uniref:TonB-dependent receptor n=2 Tax=Hyphomonas TaxID=85 RepID=Q0C3Y0_HYPNA|nr:MULTISPECIES: TonB-dependent receptor [Hyphomonas]ABI77802.1 TonB-dependent receptor [Hyphomonas neptunium ATCC 15444]KCZ96224.1 TonB-dependent receptor [Hyphomonas hirschiana VP5]
MKTRFKRGSAVSLTALSLAFGAMLPAFAEDTLKIEETIIVTSSARAVDAMAQAAATPGGTDVITHEDYADRFLVSMRDTLAFSPGVYTQPRYGQEVRISIRGSGISRGFHMRGLTLLQDGAPINLADDNGDFQELEPIFFDHLEVYRGANALRFGSGTLGGAVNGVTPTGETAPGVYVRGDVGSFETYRGLVSGGMERGKLDAWGAVSADTSHGDRDHVRRDSVRFQGNVGYDVTDAVETRFYLSLNDIDQELPGALTLSDAVNNPRKGNFFGGQARDIKSVRVQNQTRIALGEGDLAIGVWVNDKDLYHPIFQVLDYSYLDKGVWARYDWARGPFALTVGAEAREGETDARRFVNNNGKRGALVFQADQDAWTANVYAEGRYSVTDQLTLIAGAIYAEGGREQQLNLNNGLPADVLGSAEFDELSPKFGALFEVSPDIQLYANYSRSAEFPGFSELAQIAAFVPVDAQTAWTAEIGTRGRAGIASWDVSLYSADIDGEMLQFTVNPDIPAATFNADETAHRGIEAGLELAFTDWLSLRQVYQYSDFRFEGDAEFGDNALPVVPEHVYRAELRFTGDRFTVAPNLEWVPEGAWADYNNTTRTDGYTLLGITGSYKATDKIDIFLDARNLAGDKAAGDISAVITATSASAIYYPVERRAVFGGIRARF